jgi:CheY-like chemotaxis protein
MNKSSASILIDVYHNSPTAESLCTAISYVFKCRCVSISWHLTENIWYTPIISVNNSVVEKDIYNHGKPKSKDMTAYEFKDSLFYIDNDKKTELSEMYMFIFEVYLYKLRTEDICQRQKKKREIMLSNICHSIRTPLNGILHMTNELVKEGMDKDTLLYLKNSSITLANNIFDIIDITQLDLGKLILNKEVFNVKQMVNEIVTIINSIRRRNKDVLFGYYVDDMVPEYAYSDSKRIKQIVINLIDNAFKYTQKGEVNMYVYADLANVDDGSIESNQYEIIFSISDTGKGIPSEQQKYLFDPLDMVRCKQHGMGLRVSYLLAKKLEGELLLKISKPGKGSCFEFRITVYEEEQPHIDRRTLKLLKGKKMLLIDKSDDKIQIYRFLTNCGVDCINASTYHEVAMLHVGKSFDLIICSTNLNDSDNDSVIDRLRYKFPDIPFMGILTTNQCNRKQFCDTITLPIEEITFKIKLMDIFDNNNNIKKKINILIVEDEKINRIILEKLLRNAEYNHIETACDGEVAINMIKNNMGFYDVLLLDIRMPILSGFEVAEKVAELYQHNNLPIMIGVTAQMILDHEPRDYLNQFVYKPVDIKELDKKILQNIKKRDL